MPSLTEADLAAIQQRCDEALPGPWTDNSYSGVTAPLPYPHPWGQRTHDDEGPNARGGDYAWVCWIAQAPEHQGHGDELHSPQARANLAFIRDSRRDLPAVLAAYREALAALEQGQRALELAIGVANLWCVHSGNPLTTEDAAAVKAGRAAMAAALGLPAAGTEPPRG